VERLPILAYCDVPDMPPIALEIDVLGELAQAVRIWLKSVEPPAAPEAEPPAVLPDEAVVVLPVAVASVEPAAAPLLVVPVVEPAAAVSVELPVVEPPAAPVVELPAAPVAPPDAAAVSLDVPELPDIAS
jgi:periplasmic protein TonB